MVDVDIACTFFIFSHLTPCCHIIAVRLKPLAVAVIQCMSVSTGYNRLNIYIYIWGVLKFYNDGAEACNSKTSTTEGMADLLIVLQI